MDESPEIRVEKLEDAQNRAPGSKPAYVAALFKGTLLKWPGARLRISGGSYLAGEVEDSLIALGVPPAKIEILAIDAPKVFAPLGPVPPDLNLKPSLNSVGITILYRPPLKRRVSIEFKPDAGDPPVEVLFEVSPNGKEVEVGAQVAVLKNYIKKYAGASSSDPAGRDRVRTIKIATKVAGLGQFDFETQSEVATTLKAKVKEALYLEVAKGVTVEFYGAGFAKYKAKTNEVKVGTEFGAGLTFTWD